MSTLAIKKNVKTDKVTTAITGADFVPERLSRLVIKIYVFGRNCVKVKSNPYLLTGNSTKLIIRAKR